MHITLYTHSSAFDELAQEWRDLMGRSATAPIFMTVDYQKIWWQHFGEGQLRIVAVREPQNDTLVGLAPLFLINRELHFVGCVDVSDYLDILVDRDVAAQAYQALFDYLAETADVWDEGFFCSLSEKSDTPRVLMELARAKGWQAQRKLDDVCPIITLPAGWEDYLAGLNKKQRHEIRRKLRKAEAEADVRWYVISSPETLTAEAIETFITLHQKSNAEKDEFWTDAMRSFFRVLVNRFAELGWLKLYFVDVNGVPASALLCFDYCNEILVYNSGFDMARYGHLSVGNIIVSYSIRHAIELGRTRYDFLRGDEVYKFRFGAVAEDVLGVIISHKDS